MELGFQFNVDACNLPIFIGFICVMVMVVVLFVSAKGILSKVVNKENIENKGKTEDIKLIEEKRDGE